MWQKKHTMPVAEFFFISIVILGSHHRIEKIGSKNITPENYIRHDETIDFNQETVGPIFRPQYIWHVGCDIYEGRSFYIQTRKVKIRKDGIPTTTKTFLLTYFSSRLLLRVCFVSAGGIYAMVSLCENIK